MRAVYQSIRWRIQVWHTFLLVCVVAAFGVVAWLYLKKNLYDLVDAELERGMRIVASGVKPGRAENSDQPLVFQMPKAELAGYSQLNLKSFYYAIWLNSELMAEYPEAGSVDFSIPVSDTDKVDIKRSRDGFREQIRISNNQASHTFGTLKPAKRGKGRRAGDAPRVVVLVGCSILDTHSELQKLAWLLALSGTGLLVLAVTTGWLLSGKAIKPIKTISATAQEIASGDLTQRISLDDTESELGELAAVLNDSFERLKAAQTRQAQFTGDASHELRTPAFVILAQAQSALRKLRTVEEYQEGFRVCENAAKQMKELIESLLVLARHDSGDNDGCREICPLDEIVESAMELLHPIGIEKEISVSFSPGQMAVKGDARQLKQVVINLLSNTIEYTDPGGEVSISVEEGASGGTALIRVSDTGCGIAEKDLPHIFERFYRADKTRSTAHRHTGLGLAICQSVVTAHGGKISVKSSPGEGSEFVVEIPSGSIHDC